MDELLQEEAACMQAEAFKKSWELVMAFDRAAQSQRGWQQSRLEMMYEVEKRKHSVGNFMRDKSTLFSRPYSGWLFVCLILSFVWEICRWYCRRCRNAAVAGWYQQHRCQSSSAIIEKWYLILVINPLYFLAHTLFFVCLILSFACEICRL